MVLLLDGRQTVRQFKDGELCEGRGVEGLPQLGMVWVKNLDPQNHVSYSLVCSCSVVNQGSPLFGC